MQLKFPCVALYCPVSEETRLPLILVKIVVQRRLKKNNVWKELLWRAEKKTNYSNIYPRSPASVRTK
jgi:hypothetical protein